MEKDKLVEWDTPLKSRDKLVAMGRTLKLDVVLERIDHRLNEIDLELVELREKSAALRLEADALITQANVIQAANDLLQQED